MLQMVFLFFTNCFIFRIDKTANLNLYDALINNRLEEEKMVSFAVQLSVLVLFQELNLKIEAVYGDGLGKLVASFYYGLVTLQEAILRAMAITRNNISDKQENNLDIIANFKLSSKNKSMFNNSTIDKTRNDFFIRENFLPISKKSIIIDFSDMASNANTRKVIDMNSLLETLGRFVLYCLLN